MIRNFSQTNDYDVLKKAHSDTLSTEKKLIENMTQQIGEDIINFFEYLRELNDIKKLHSRK